MRKRELCAVPAVVVLALGLAACGSRTRAEAGNRDAANLAPDSGVKAGGKAVFPQKEFDFGDVEQDQTITHDFAVRNEGQEVLHINKVHGS